MKKKKNNLFLSPTFIAFAIILIHFKNLGVFLIYFLVVAMHELAHYTCAKKLGYKLGKFYVMPYGVCLNYNEPIFNISDEFYISLAGPAINLLFCFISVALWWMFPDTYYYLDYFCYCNLTLGLFNLLPCFPLDGGRVFVALLSKKIDREKALKITYALNYVVSFCLIILFITSLFKGVNFSYIIIAIFLFSGTINPNKYSSYNYLMLGTNREKIIKNGAGVKLFVTPSSTPLYKIMAKFSKYKYNIVYVVFNDGMVRVFSEYNINSLAVKYSPKYNICQILTLKKTLKMQ